MKMSPSKQFTLTFLIQEKSNSVEIPATTLVLRCNVAKTVRFQRAYRLMASIVAVDRNPNNTGVELLLTPLLSKQTYLTPVK